MAEEKKKQVFKLDNAGLKEPEVLPSLNSPEGQRTHVSLFLHATQSPIWERPGKIAFAKHHKMEWVTGVEPEKKFQELFAKY